MITASDIRKKCHSGKYRNFSTIGWFERSYLLHRELSLWLSCAVLNHLPWVRPNQVSMAMIIFGMLGCSFLFIGTPEFGLLACLFLYLSFLLDKVDGDIARYREEYSKYGKYLDELYHLFPQTLLFTALGFGIRESQPNELPMAIGLLGTFLAMFNRLSPKLTTLVEMTWNLEPAASNPETPSSSVVRRTVNSVVLLFIRFDLIVLLLVGGFLADIVYGPYPRYAFCSLVVLVVSQALFATLHATSIGRRLP